MLNAGDILEYLEKFEIEGMSGTPKVININSRSNKTKKYSKEENMNRIMFGIGSFGLTLDTRIRKRAVFNTKNVRTSP